MYPLWRDIRDRLGEPLWHDGYGVPRYDQFHPSLLGIYDDWAVLFVVRCQACQRDFLCANGMSELNIMADSLRKTGDRPKDSQSYILRQVVEWGDAPWHELERGQCAGTTMTTDIVQIKEVWNRVRPARDWVPIDIPLELANWLCDEGLDSETREWMGADLGPKRSV